MCLFAMVAASCARPQPSSTGPGATPVPPTARPTGSTATCATRTLAQMSEEQRVGQLFLLGIEGDTLSPAEIAAIEKYHLGSVWLIHSRNGGVASVRRLSDAIQALATAENTDAVRFFVAADQEGGLVQRLNGPGFASIPSALAQGELSPAVLQGAAATWGSELEAAGINLNLAPVMDVVPPGQDATNEPIGALNREYGHDPTTVGDHGAAVIRGMARAGVATTLKHFPGLGRVTGNTDRVAIVVDGTTTANDPRLGAFRTGIEAGAPFVMVSLATYTAIDPDHPAVFSPEIMGTLLRGTLGFEGVVMSDDLGAAAAVSSLPPGDRATAFIAAGGDFMIVGGVDRVGQMAAAVLDRVGSDPAFAAQVDAASTRILEAKAAYGLISCE
jgi:beta-N-acetylhexosaminidase